MLRRLVTPCHPILLTHLHTHPLTHPFTHPHSRPLTPPLTPTPTGAADDLVQRLKQLEAENKGSPMLCVREAPPAWRLAGMMGGTSDDGGDLLSDGGEEVGPSGGGQGSRADGWELL